MKMFQGSTPSKHTTQLLARPRRILLAIKKAFSTTCFVIGTPLRTKVQFAALVSFSCSRRPSQPNLAKSDL